jgi:hypothetical protein
MQLSFSHKIKKLKGKYQKCVLENLYLMLNLLLISKTVNLFKQKEYAQGVLESQSTQVNSHYKRLLRFMKDHSTTALWFDCLSGIISMLRINSKTYYLDGTEWTFGSIKIHILCLCVNWNGVATPVYFRPYWHKGVLSEVTRIRFMRRVMRCIDLTDKIIIADREFIGNNWFTFFNEYSIRFIIRIRENMYKKELLEGKVYEELRKKAIIEGYAKAHIKINDKMYRIEFWKNSHSANKEEPVIFLLTNILNKNKVGRKYSTRWRIEYCFKHLKTNGFDLEDMSWRELSKIRLCLSLVICVYVLALRDGHLKQKQDIKQNIKITKKYKNGDVYFAESTFRTGLALITFFSFTITYFTKYLNQIKIKKNNFYKIVQ